MTVMDRRCFAPSASIPLLFDFYVLVFELIYHVFATIIFVLFSVLCYLNDPKIHLWCALVQINCHLGIRSNNTEMNGIQPYKVNV